MTTRPSGFCMRDPIADVVENAFLQVERGYGHFFQLSWLCVSRDEIEDARHVPRNDRVGREERKVRIDARRDWVIIPRADMHVRL